jgi:hypothetical protein
VGLWRWATGLGRGMQAFFHQGKYYVHIMNNLVQATGIPSRTHVQSLSILQFFQKTP